jgi:hypothetical protein
VRRLASDGGGGGEGAELTGDRGGAAPAAGSEVTPQHRKGKERARRSGSPRGVDPRWCGTARGGSGEDGAAPAARGAPPRRGGARGPAHEDDEGVSEPGTGGATETEARTTARAYRGGQTVGDRGFWTRSEDVK